jgi:predicted metalloprotease with PDZ domain
MTPLRYRIFAADPHAHVFEVSCSIDDPAADGQVFRLPSWVPGSYLIREFARHFVAVHAESEGSRVAVTKIAKDAWQAAACAGPLTLVAQVYAFDLSVRAAYLDATRGFFNGPAVFVWPVGHEHRPCTVEIVAPAGDRHAQWRVATSMPSAGAAPNGYGMYRAANYDELVDHPVEMGTFDLVHFDAGGARHAIAVTGRHRGDLERLARDTQRICQAQIDLFGAAQSSRAPLDHYLFQLLVLADGYGGLEHRASTSLVSSDKNLPRPGSADVDDDYRRLLGLVSHEYFHAWNVKRIKPAAFLPYDLTREAYTRQLWAFEGITSYYDDLVLVRSGLISADSYLELLGQNLTTLLRTPGRHRQSVAESSFDAWIKHYRQDENSPNAIVSYYVKGAFVGLALDLTLRRDSRITLDDVMRALWQRYGRPGIGVPEGGLESVAGELSGLDLAPFFRDFVDGTLELPLASLLRTVGVDLQLRRSQGGNDKGGTPARGGLMAVWLGAQFGPGSELRVKTVLNGSPAERAGLAPGDAIVALDGVRASAAGIDDMLKTRRPGEAVDLHAFRREALLAFRVELEQAPEDACWLALDQGASADAQAHRWAWLGAGSAG